MDVSLAFPGPAIGCEWQALARRSLSPSGYNAPELLLPAFKRQPKAILATVRDSEGLQLAMPLIPSRLPFRFHASLSTPVSFFGLPHLGRYQAIPAMMALLRQLNQPLLLRSVPIDSIVWDVAKASAPHFAILDTWERATLRPEGSYAEWFDASFERKRRKEYRRLQARLSESGKLAAVSLGAAGDAVAWTDEFLELESRGWKGKRGTALNADPITAETLRECLAGLAAAGKLRFWKLALDGRPIAMLFAIVEGREAWLGKIAHDEDLARFSPGVQLILHATEQIFAEGITVADSCADADHPMINHLWRTRLRVADVMIAAPTVDWTAFNMTLEAERLRRRIRASAKSIYCRLTGRRH